jgi:uncharacterized membrane protein
MKHITALFIKYAMITVILGIVIAIFTEVRLSHILYISLGVTLLAYVIGDLLILPAANNTAATIADAGIALLLVYLSNFIWNVRLIPFWVALICGLLVAAGEWFFHKYVDRNVFPNRRRT